nr:uncharacterized protein LOC129386222 [Dermacentor andersoni]
MSGYERKEAKSLIRALTRNNAIADVTVGRCVLSSSSGCDRSGTRCARDLHYPDTTLQMLTLRAKCSRNEQLLRTLVSTVSRMTTLTDFNADFCLYGEGFGQQISNFTVLSNRNKLLRLRCRDISVKLSRHAASTLASADLGKRRYRKDADLDGSIETGLQALGAANRVASFRVSVLVEVKVVLPAWQDELNEDPREDVSGELIRAVARSVSPSIVTLTQIKLEVEDCKAFAETALRHLVELHIAPCIGIKAPFIPRLTSGAASHFSLLQTEPHDYGDNIPELKAIQEAAKWTRALVEHVARSVLNGDSGDYRSGARAIELVDHHPRLVDIIRDGAGVKIVETLPHGSVLSGSGPTLQLGRTYVASWCGTTTRGVLRQSRRSSAASCIRRNQLIVH